MKCIVVDDEPFALELIEGYIQKTPFLNYQKGFTNPFKALSFLINTTVDLIFLDINMPELSGIQLLKSLPAKPLVIFTTAYSEYAAESYEYNAVDYLLKPVKYERFLKAASKAFELQADKNPTKNEPNPVAISNDFVLIKSGTHVHKLRIEEILYVQGAGNYMTFYTKDKKILSLMKMKEVIQLLPNNLFIRIHKSYVVSLNHIEIIEKHQVRIHGVSIPIGITYRAQFNMRIERNF